MVALNKVVSEFILISPREFSDTAALKVSTDAAIAAIADASGAAAVLDTEMITVLGNIYLVIIYQLA
tara:strand:+ start:563 stop:763 length:201 start_codon:yes stop_codon:yes gene_type:complete